MTHFSIDSPVAEYVQALRQSALGYSLTCHKIFEGCEPVFAAPARPWARAVENLLREANIPSLYKHQAEAVDVVRSGGDVVVATPTASGKSLIYNLPVIERHLSDPDACSLYLFPLKALAQDQFLAFESLTASWPQDARPRAAIYDGDTTAHFRKKIRENPPTVLFTNPEMLHLALLPHHNLWSAFFAGISHIVVDEVHTYRGLLGAHMAQVFRRLLRVAELYGAHPTFIFSSATIGNPVELTSRLTGREAVPVVKSGAPQGKRHYLFLNPEESPSSTTIKLLKSALSQGLRTIVYCQSRRVTELISLWVSQHAKEYSGKISAYRAGYLPEERRDIEARMASGELLAVISTSALELGIDIGALDLCILVGYPGSVMATLQRGGRVGRSQRESAVILVAQEDALDQFVVRNPNDFFAMPAERAICNPENPVIVAKHLECAAAELPIRLQRPFDASWIRGSLHTVAQELINNGTLLLSGDGTEIMASRKRPQRHVALRGSGVTIAIMDEKENLVGSVDSVRAMREVHPGALYLHRGQYYEVQELDFRAGMARVKPCRLPWYTRTRSVKNTTILEVKESRICGGMLVQFGRLRVSDLVTGYEKRATSSGQLLGVVPLDFEPLVFETEGFWFHIPSRVQRLTEEARLHFMGAIHALEHAVIGLLPLLVMTDRNDLGGISTPMHMQTGSPTVFVYDGMPGGAGLCKEAFEKADELFIKVSSLVKGCPCELGCPACVHSPKCGSGNRPIDKAGAVFVVEGCLEALTEDRAEAEKIRELPLVIPEEIPLLAQLSSPAQGGTAFTPASDASRGATTTFRQGMEAVRVDALTGEDGRQNALTTQQGAVPALRESFGESSMKKTQNGHNGLLTLPGMGESSQGEASIDEAALLARQASSYAVLDVETRYSAKEVGGWHKTAHMGVSVVVVYDSRTGAYTAYGQDEIPLMVENLGGIGVVVGFNITKFDYSVLAPHAQHFDFRRLPTIDLLTCVYRQLSYRVSLDNIASATLGARKSADGLLALQWWKEQKLDLIREYCEQDVALTKDVYWFGKENGHVLFTNKAGQTVRVRATWAG